MGYVHHLAILGVVKKVENLKFVLRGANQMSHDVAKDHTIA